MTEAELAEIKARADAATPGPWTTHDLPQPVGGQTVTVHSESGPPSMAWTVELPSEIGGMVLAPDADFITHAREDVPALVTEVERLRSERDALQAKLDKVRALATENGAFPQGHSLFGSGAEHFVGGASLLAIFDGGAA